jgi:hypothetical protein
MGLASSQARLLLLTARKSDLEYRAQSISQRQMNIAMQTEQLATEYSTAMSNRKMSLTTWVTTTSNDTQTVKDDLTFAGLLGVGTNVSGEYLVTDANGSYVYSDDDTLIELAYKLSGTDFSSYKDNDGNLSKTAKAQILSYLTTPKDNGGKLGVSVTEISEVNITEFFQDALRNGSLYLQKQTSTEGTGSTFDTISWSSCASITDSYNTADDAEAEAEYEAQTLVLSNQDKMLDLELNQIETQHSAIESEYESVKKVIDKNIETSFKIFS